MASTLPKRRSIRLQGYDYSQAGCYFVTICTHERKHYFGEIVGATLCGRPNNPHKMIEKWLLELENKYADVTIGPYVVMPNHVHLMICKSNTQLGDRIGTHTGDHMGKHTGDHIGSPLQDVVGWFKTMTTNEYIRDVKNGLYEPFNKKLWQRNYYEHIIRDERDFLRIAEYIEKNPITWDRDSLNGGFPHA